MKRTKFFCARFPQIPFQQIRPRSGQINHNQTIQYAGKIGIHAEIHNPSAQFQVVFQKNGDSFVVALEVSQVAALDTGLSLTGVASAVIELGQEPTYRPPAER